MVQMGAKSAAVMQIHKYRNTCTHARNNKHTLVPLWFQQCWSQSIHSLGNVTAKAKTTAPVVVTSPRMEILLMYEEPGVNTKGELGILVAIINSQDYSILIHSNIEGKHTRTNLTIFGTPS